MKIIEDYEEDLIRRGALDFIKSEEYFPVPVLFECRSGEFPETGIWLQAKRKEGEYRSSRGYKYSLLDTLGYFHTEEENLTLDEGEKRGMKNFVTLFREEIKSLKDGTLPFSEFTYILSATRERTEKKNLLLATKSVHDEVVSLNNKAIIKKDESGLDANIALDLLSGYRLNDFTTDGAKRIWVQKNTADEYERDNGFYWELDETLCYSYIRPTFFREEVALKRKERSGIRAFIENNRILLSTICDLLDTGVDISFFHDNFIPGPLLRTKKERRALERKVREKVTEYRSSKHYREDYKYSDTYYRQKTDASRIN